MAFARWPRAATARDYKEIFNSDAERFGGTDILNPHLKKPYREPFGEAPCHITVSVPPLAAIMLQPQKIEEE